MPNDSAAPEPAPAEPAPASDDKANPTLSGGSGRGTLKAFRSPPAPSSFLPLTALAAAAAAFLYQSVRSWQAAPSAGLGWLVPVLIAYFFAARWRDRPAPGPDRIPPLSPASWPVAAGCAAIIILARLFLEPFPGWPMIEWAYTAALVSLCLLVLRSWLGGPTARHLAFPLWLSLAALPWPTLVEAVWIPQLRIVLAALVAEICNLAGEPAVAHGTVIQIGGASIGIEEACGGIRSLQLAVILALAIGELRRDRWKNRLGWLVTAAALALFGNALRLIALTWLYGRNGPANFDRWHDRLDWLEMAFVLGTLGARFVIRAAGVNPPPSRRARAGAIPIARRSGHGDVRGGILAAGLIATLAAAEGFAGFWFSQVAGAVPPAAQWTACLAANSPGFVADPFTPTMQALLDCDAHQLGHWTDAGGARRAAYVVEWHRGQSARFTLLMHNPDICLPNFGSKLIGPRPPIGVPAGAATLPFGCHEFSDERGRFYVYYLAWNISAGKPFGESGEAMGKAESWLHAQWKEVAAHRRQIGVRVIAVAIFDAPTAARADEAFQTEAARILARG